MSLVYQKLPAPDREILERKYQDHYESWERALFEIHRRIRSQLSDLDIRATVKYRVKSFSSYYKKLITRAGQKPDAHRIELTDLLGIRIVCPFMEDLELVEKLLSEEYSLKEREKKGAEFSFKEFGYESVHFLCEFPGEIRESFHLPSDTVFEIQLRTILQDAWAEVEHELVYKSEYTAFDEPLRRKLAALNANLSLADMIFHEIRVFQRELQRQIQRRRDSFVEMVQDINDQGVNGGDTRGNGLLDGDPDHLQMDTSDIPSSGNPGDNLLLRALYAHNRHQYLSAIELYTRLLEEDPRTTIVPIVLIHRGMAYFSLGKYDLAHGDFDRAVESGSDLKRAYHYRGLSFGRSGDDRAALLDFCKSLEYDSSQFDVLMSRGQTYFRLGNLQDALKDCDAALKLDPESAQAHRFHGQITQQLGM